jgi:hypothetical protein
LAGTNRPSGGGGEPVSSGGAPGIGSRVLVPRKRRMRWRSRRKYVEIPPAVDADTLAATVTPVGVMFCQP